MKWQYSGGVHQWTQ